jgi:S-adenosylmethionine decarboxylase
MNDKGYHYILDLTLKDENILKRSDLLKCLFEAALTKFNILKYDEYKFTTGGCGVTAVFLLSESHCSYHTYPENNYIAIDIFTCGKDPTQVVNLILQRLSPINKRIICLKRGSKLTQNFLELDQGELQ